MGPEGVKVGLGAAAIGAAWAAFDSCAGSWGVDAAAGELIELSFGDERDDDSIGVELDWTTEAEDAPDIMRAIRRQRLGSKQFA